MIRYSAEAIGQIDELRLYYLRKSYIEAAIALDRTLERAEQSIERQPNAGIAAPRPYPSLARPGRAWLHVGRYWLRYTLDEPHVILGVYYDAADIPGRLSAGI